MPEGLEFMCFGGFEGRLWPQATPHNGVNPKDPISATHAKNTTNFLENNYN